jgi:hypothetical protein
MREAAFKATVGVRRMASWLAVGITDLSNHCALGWRVLQSMLREIFDESAYARFLARRHLASSSHAYAEFLAESGQYRERRPHCC